MAGSNTAFTLSGANGKQRSIAAVVRLLLPLLAFSGTIFSVLSANAQSRYGQENVILPQPPRELRRILDAAERAIKNEEYSDAVEALREIIDAPLAQDFFLPPKQPKGRYDRSLKQRAVDLLGGLPRDGKDIYELEVGAEARRLLKQAIEEGNLDDLREVSRRYFHTKTGYQATMLMARAELDEGHPIAAVLHLQRLLKSKSAMDYFGHEVPFLMASCWQISGDHDQAESVITKNMDRLAGAKVTIAGEAKTLPEDAAELTKWLKESLGDGINFRSGTGDDWMLARGNASRNANVEGGLPLAKLEWRMEPAGPAVDGPDASIIRNLHYGMINSGTPTLSALQPLAINDQLLFRTARRMFGGVISEGRLVWEGPEDEPFPVNSTNRDANVQKQMRAQHTALLKRRMCEDATYGNMSSDGRRLFMINGSRAAFNPYMGYNRLGTYNNGTQASNELIALELASEGKMVWSTSHEWDWPAFFLGAPLPIGNDLFAIAEIKDEITLVCLDPANGRQKWSQQLAQVESNTRYNMAAKRRLAGATPSFADGILVCPTSSGVVVGVDIASRSLAWAYDYSPQIQQRTPQFNSRFNTNQTQGQSWADSTVVIDRGLAVISPVESNELHCINLLSGAGKPKWKIPRKNMLCVGGVHEGVLVVAEKNGIRCIDMETGKFKHELIKHPKGAFTSGRGFLSDGHYYLPIAQGEDPPTGMIVRLNVVRGTVETQQTERVLGNLICHGDYLISQGLDGIYGYALRDRRKTAVMAAVKAGEVVDPEILEDYASILQSEGDEEKAIAVMRQALEKTEDAGQKPIVKSLLLKMITRAMENDFANFSKLQDEATSLATTAKEQTMLAEVVAAGQIQIKDYENALASHLVLVDQLEPDKPLTEGEQPPMGRLRSLEFDSEHRVSTPVGLARQIDKILANLDDADSATETIRKRIAGSVDEEDQPLPKLMSRLSVFENLPEFDKECSALRFEIAKQQLDASGVPLRTPLNMLAHVAGSPYPNATQASYLLADAYQANHPDLAKAAFARLAKDGESITLNDGSTATGKELQDQFESGTNSKPKWNQGKVKVTSSGAPQQYISQFYEVNLASQTKEWPTGSRIYIKGSPRPLQLNVVNASGKVTHRVRLDSFNTMLARYGTARHYGHTLVVSLGDRILGIDLLAKNEGDNFIEPIWVFRDTRSDYSRGIATHTVNINFMEPRYYAVNQSGTPHGMLGAIGPHGVCVMKGLQLTCLDLETGLPRWAVRNAGSRVTIFGDESKCFVSKESNGETRVFDMRTGAELESVKVSTTNRWATFGKQLLHYTGMHSNGKHLKIILFDCEKQKTVWTDSDIDANSKARIINNEELAIMSPKGTLKIRRIADGEILLETRVDPEPKLISLHVWKTDSQYLVAVNRSDTLRYSKLIRSSVSVSNPCRLSSAKMQFSNGLFNGHLYAFDTKTQKLLWDPVSVEQYGLPLSQPNDSPLFVMSRRVRRRVGKTNKYTTETAFVNKKTGRAKLYSDGKSGATYYNSEIIAYPEIQQITMNNLTAEIMEEEPEDTPADVLVEVPLTVPPPEKPKKEIKVKAKPEPKPVPPPKPDQLDDLFGFQYRGKTNAFGRNAVRLPVARLS